VPGVIVMERIVGKTIYEVEHEDKDIYAKLLAQFNFKSVYYDAVYHGDIHPGNIFFIKELKSESDCNSDDDDSDGDSDDERNEEKKSMYNYRIGLIDFGIIGVLSRELQNTIFNLFKGLYEKEHKNVAYCIIDNLIEPKDALTVEQRNELIEIMSSYSEKHFERDSQKFLDAEDIIKINIILYDYGVQFSKEFCKIELSFAISDSVCKLLINKTTYMDQLLSIFSRFD
jgi:predicted unusual protein kinase regulating ubiquinone biosynthesis (AarF/ABC1/UbiB family)